MIVDNFSQIDYSSAGHTLSLTDWWDGDLWRNNDPWSTNTVNRFRPDVATLYSAIAVPEDHVVSICTGNPKMPYWGTLAPGQTGTYVNLTILESPENLAFGLQKDANRAMWKAVQVLGTSPSKETEALWANSEDQYWEAVWWLDRSVLVKESNDRAVAYGRASTLFAGAIAGAELIQEICRR